MHHPLLEVTGWPIFIGRFHPVIVHLPIGFLLILALLEIMQRFSKIRVSQDMLRYILLWSAISSTLACVAGYLLASGGGYQEMLLSNHQWQGIAVAAFSWIAWIVGADQFRKKIQSGRVFYFATLGIAVALTLAAGHQGGSLTHGEGYLTQHTPEPFRSITGMQPSPEQADNGHRITDIQQAVVYTDIVKPILERRCTQCHNASKQKGDLRMDQIAMLVKGGESGPALITGNSAQSKMILRCMLPENDDKHMPPKGKPQLTQDEILLLSWWIDKGAPAEKRVADLKISGQIEPALATIVSNANSAAPERAMKPSLFSKEIPKANVKDIEALRAAGLIVNNLSNDQHFLEVSAVNSPGFDDGECTLLTPLSEQVTWLKLAGTNITDTALSHIAALKNLSKLHLEHTAITDRGLAQLKNLTHLEYLNLTHTKITDTGLKTIASMKSLKSIYVWQSAVTDSAVAQLTRQYPKLSIVNGVNVSGLAQSIKKTDQLEATAKKH
ncbi:c-type cytochrome domain-containing protein [Dyadobacter sp. CY343]|uniref:c-type cytochrome domain-containing protein n=1 Tax=Dyadobacter sp. CY343 TaxID=2907299 RepID=UPI001F382CCB|nr:c-type cytochrome domain-containing protein [Dyadobacter sp. CY343]MCE7063388.1 ribonuclease inhibitor [Dyadobacter sp. CY343]